MWGSLKFAYEVSNQTVENRIDLNRTMKSKTKAHTAKSCEIQALLRCYTAQCGNFVPMFQDYLSVTASEVKKPKKENRAWRKLTETILFWPLLPVF